MQHPHVMAAFHLGVKSLTQKSEALVAANHLSSTTQHLFWAMLLLLACKVGRLVFNFFACLPVGMLSLQLLIELINLLPIFHPKS